MTSQPDLQSIAIHNLPNTSQNKDNQTMKFGQLIEYNKINFFLQKSKKKALHKVKAGSLQLGFNKF